MVKLLVTFRDRPIFFSGGFPQHIGRGVENSGWKMCVVFFGWDMGIGGLCDKKKTAYRKNCMNGEIMENGMSPDKYQKNQILVSNGGGKAVYVNFV